MTADLLTPDLLEVLRRSLGASYVVERELGGGGMSRLFLARDSGLDRRVVVKVLPPELASRANAIRFEREVAVTAQLQHPHIIPVVAAGAHDDVLYYITPHIEGETLRQRLDRERRLPVPAALEILREVAGAIAFAHSRGVVHRDIKPENILLTRGHVCVTDFGIAHALDEASAGVRVTRPGSGVGTFGYMAPEQAAGRPDVDGRADVYALAVLAYEMLTGEIPLPGLTAESRAPWRRSAPYAKLPADLPHRVRDAIARGLAVDPASRLASVAAFRDALAPRPPGPWDPRPLVGPAVAAATVAVVAALVVLVVLAVRGGTGRATSPPALAPPASALDSNVVVFLPFGVLGVDPALGVAVPASLRSFVDGAGPLRAMLQGPAGTGGVERLDASAAAALARKVRGRFVAFGEVAGAGRDSLRVGVTLVDAARGEVVTRFEDADATARSSVLVGRLVRRLLGAINERQPIAAVRSGAIAAGTRSELWWYLRGERYYRTNDEDSAAVAYREALASGDSTSALGLRRLRTVLRGIESEWNAASMEYAVRAGALNRGLGPRDSMLVLADSLYGAIIRAPNDPRRMERIRRWLRTLEAAVRAYPIDAEVRYDLGEAQYHFGQLAGVEPETVLATFEEAIRLDPGFAQPYVHAIPLAMRLRSRDSTLRLIEAHLRIRPDDETHRFVAALLRPRPRGESDAAARSRVAAMLGAMSNRDVQRLIFQLRAWPDSDHALGQVFAELDRRLATGSPPSRPGDALETRGAITRQAFRAAFVRGRLGEARRLAGSALPDTLPGEFALLAEFGGIPADSADAVFERWLRAGDAERLPYALSWWADRANRGALERAAAVADVASRPAVSGAPSMAPYTAAAGRAYLALLRGDTSRALALLGALPDTLCPRHCPPDRIVLARLLLARRRPLDADSVLRRHPPNLNFPSLSDGLWWLARGRAAGALGDTALAERRYGLVAQLWGGADPPLRRLVDQARHGPGAAGGGSPPRW